MSGTVYLSLHINGTFRAHWADKLGFCECSEILLIMPIVNFRKLEPMYAVLFMFGTSIFYIGKNAGVPLSFKCIKSSGGPVPWTLVGVSRKYPVLYKER